MKIYTEDTHEAKFLVVGCSNGGDSFEDRMISGLDISTLLKPVFFTDELERYDISGYQSLDETMKNRRLNRDEILDILISVDTSIRYLEERMLGDANILLDPMFIYTEAGHGNILFPVTRGSSDLFSERMRKLSELLFIQADFDDPETLKFAAGLMRICLSDSFRMHDIMYFIERSRKEKIRSLPVKTDSDTETVGTVIVPTFDDVAKQTLFEQDVTEKNGNENAFDGKKIRTILLIGAVVVSVLDIICMVLGNGKAARLLPFLLIISAAAVGYNVYAAVSGRKKN
ncbi:MAG: DUF6382 domain-containing protein [Lachnospiraceae bacterium]|nr:DUF6382 domain-containing protein [Lachnospiraceae bacterium]